MSQSDWIALAACVAAFLALVPSFSGMLRTSRSRKRRQNAPAKDLPTEPATPPSERPQPHAFIRALACISMALILGVAEVVVFSSIALAYGVTVDTKTMQDNWSIVYYGMFVLPGYFLFLAVAHISTVME